MLQQTHAVVPFAVHAAVHVQVDEAGSHKKVGEIDHLHIRIFSELSAVDDIADGFIFYNNNLWYIKTFWENQKVFVLIITFI